MNPRIATAAVGALALGLTAGATTASADETDHRRATGPFRIDVIRYAQNGDRLNTEWIQVRNITNRARNLRGWQIFDPGDHQRYRFPRTRVPAHRAVTLYTGSGRDGYLKRYWRKDSPMWNNDGDRANLLNPTGALRDTCQYAGGGTSVDCWR